MVQQGDDGATLRDVQALKARVQNGRIVVDEPTDLPEGMVLDLVIADPGDELDEKERAELHAALEEGLAEMRTGAGIEADVLLAELRARG
ncbi:hypothetical protein [Sorangium sp. So ce693]|uniref:hypothetical protein n=1 Tax=Sorangium sp. So ce693 TaxID=3133318 RepID=UPI003F63653A